MYKNYFILNRFAEEQNEKFAGYSVDEIFSQEKDKLVFHMHGGGGESYLEISVNPGFPYIVVKDDFRRAKKNTIDFFTGFLPAKLEAVEIAVSDRIIRLKLSNSSIYFAIRGKYTDVFLLDNMDNIYFFKKFPDENTDEFIREIKSIDFTAEVNIPVFNENIKNDFFEAIKKYYPFVGKEILSELKARSNNGAVDEMISRLKQIITEIFTEAPAVYLDEKSFTLQLRIKSFKSNLNTDFQEFGNIYDAINFYINKKYFYDSAGDKKKRIQKHLERELIKLSNKLNSLKTNIDNGSKEDEYLKLGNLLLININKIKAGMRVIEVEDIYEGEKNISIKLDEKLSPRKNADLYFEKSKGDRIRLEKSKKLYSENKILFNRLNELQKKAAEAGSIGELVKIMKELKMKDNENQNEKEDIRIKFKHYIIENKYNVYVGKDSQNNDLLTVKFAKQNDYWFHARSVPGSHVVLRVDNIKEAVPKNILKKVAALAAFHSKAKTSGTAPVSFTLKKYVVKKKGMEPGKVALLKEDVLLVKPEVPADCEYITND